MVKIHAFIAVAQVGFNPWVWESGNWDLTPSHCTPTNKQTKSSIWGEITRQKSSALGWTWERKFHLDPRTSNSRPLPSPHPPPDQYFVFGWLQLSQWSPLQVSLLDWPMLGLRPVKADIQQTTQGRSLPTAPGAALTGVLNYLPSV